MPLILSLCIFVLLLIGDDIGSTSFAGNFEPCQYADQWTSVELPDGIDGWAIGGSTKRFTVLYLGSSVGLYRSFDCGTSWEYLGMPGATDSRVMRKTPWIVSSLAVINSGTFMQGPTARL